MDLDEYQGGWLKSAGLTDVIAFRCDPIVLTGSEESE